MSKLLDGPAPNSIAQGHVLDVLRQMPSGMVDMCVTSPPYWSLRDYKTPPQVWDAKNGCEHEWDEEHKAVQSGGGLAKGGNQTGGNKNWQLGERSQGQFCLHCNAWRGSLGLEPTIGLYLSHLYAIFDEVKRVLKDEGTLWVNLGDSYGGSGGCKGHTPESENKGRKTFEYGAHHGVTNYKAKSLCLIPQRFAIGMVERGWLCRNVLIWHKPNPMPSSASDRFTVDFEYVYFFVKQGRYYFEQQFEAHTAATIQRSKYHWCKPNTKAAAYQNISGLNRDEDYPIKSQGRNQRCVLTIPTFAFPEAHFATYPPKLIEPLIRAGCPEFVCKKCGKGRKKIYEPLMKIERNQTYDGKQIAQDKNFSHKRIQMFVKAGREAGLPHDNTTVPKVFKYLTDCGCGASFVPGVVLDPFLGSGTTALVALSLNRNYVGIELSEKYVKMAQSRLNKPIQVKL